MELVLKGRGNIIKYFSDGSRRWNNLNMCGIDKCRSIRN